MVGLHHRLNGYELEQTLGDGEGQESLARRSYWVVRSQTQLRDQTRTNDAMS